MLANTVHYVVYNGIQLNLTKIESFDSVSEYDPLGVDRLYNHVTLRVTGVINGQVNYGGYDNATFLTFLRSSLMEPRRPLAVYINGVATINVSGPDAKNGPTPSNVKVYEFTGATLMAEFAIDYWEPVCSSSGLVILTNRWRQKSDIDQDGMTTLTSTGRIVIDNSKTAINADQYRNVPYPVANIPQGFVRTSQSFEVSEDGNTMEWSVTDQEVYLPPPQYTDDAGKPQKITRWSGTWREESSMEQGGGAVIQGTLSVQAWGEKNVSKNMLLLFCVRVFQSRWDQGNDVIRHYAFEEGLNENSVSLSVTVITFSKKDFEKTKLQATTRIGNSLDIYDVGQPPSAVSNRGNAGLWLVIKDIVATCAAKNTSAVVGSNTVNQTPTFIGTIPAKGTKALAKEDNDVKQPDNTPYTLSHITTQVDEDQNTIQLARASGDSDTESFYSPMASPISKAVVRFRMERLNAAPELPQLTLGGRRLLKTTINMNDPLLLPSGVDRIYSISGQYIFGYDKTAQVGYKPLTMPSAITDSQGIASQNIISSSNFITGLIADS